MTATGISLAIVAVVFPLTIRLLLELQKRLTAKNRKAGKASREIGPLPQGDSEVSERYALSK